MRKCVRCECDMVANYDVKVEGGAYGLKITKPGLFKSSLGKIRVAVCPKLYVLNVGTLNFILKIPQR